MPAYTVYAEQLPGLLKVWSAKYEVQIPTAQPGGFFDFAPWREGAEIAWDYDLAYNSLKRFFLPPHEDLLTYDVGSCEAQPVFQSPPLLLFGVHPYDLRAIVQLDQIMEAGSPDQYYLRRRENVAIFALEPMRIAATAFWGSMGTGVVDVGYDLYWTKIGPAAFFVEAGSTRGEEMLNACGPVEAASTVDREAARKIHENVQKQAGLNGLRFPWQEVPQVLAKSWSSPLWREKARLCLGCGSCNVVCPTCYCFDVREELDETLGAGHRFRVWDACMIHSFALVAGDHNFRAQARERYRHRYFRKGKYIHDMIGELGCVGCGRCVRACTAHIANPKEVFNALWEETR